MQWEITDSDRRYGYGNLHWNKRATSNIHDWCKSLTTQVQISRWNPHKHFNFEFFS